MKKGDVVKIIDFSYSARVTEKGLSNKGICEPNSEQEFRIVVIGCGVPTYKIGETQRIADTVLLGQKDGAVWFAKSDLLRPVKHKITIDDKTIEISDESYQKLKAQLT